MTRRRTFGYDVIVRHRTEISDDPGGRVYCIDCGKTIRQVNMLYGRCGRYPLSFKTGLTARRAQRFREAMTVAFYLNQYPASTQWTAFMAPGIIAENRLTRPSPYRRMLEKHLNPSLITWRTL